MNRAARILAEWNTRVAACGAFTSGEARKNNELTTLQAKLANKTRECTELHHQRRGRYRDRRPASRQHPATSRTRPTRPTHRPAS